MPKKVLIEATHELCQALLFAQTALQGEQVTHDEAMKATGQIADLMVKLQAGL